MAKSLFEELGGKYERQGDYLIPCLTVPAEEEQAIGIWGQRHLDYLKQYRKVTYTNLHKVLNILYNSSGLNRQWLNCCCFHRQKGSVLKHFPHFAHIS